jgi:hypothetical protein
MIGQIELTEAEKDLASKIVFDLEKYNRLERDAAIENGELSAALMQSLMDREAIPANRLRYFTDAAYNPGKSTSSRADLFLRNAGTVEEMFRHGHFALLYLSYFVYGADLPTALKEAFFAKAQKYFGTTEQLIQLARQQVRELHRVPNSQDYSYPDAFYQLALDCGCEEWDARAVRQAVMAVKKK